jgi:geranylgeranyl reductase family protein
VQKFDVAIVGAGPAGAWAALGLAAGGARVALIDASHPREKPCGGGVTRRALQLVGSSVARMTEGLPIETASFAYRDRLVTVPVAAPTGGPRLTVVPRLAFDAWLVERARSAGATLLQTRATDVTRDGVGWRVRTRDGDVDARWIIGADGPASLVRRRVLAPFARRDLSIAAGYYVAAQSPPQIAIALEDEPAGYLWAFPRRGHLAVGACAQADATTTATMLAMSERWIDRHAPHGERQRYSWPIPSLPVASLERQHPGGDGWLLAGDAAGLVDPITREGIFFALSSGGLAASAILAGADPARRYVEQLRDTIYAELLEAARLKARFFRPHFMRLLVSALQRSGRIRGVMADLVAGEQSYHTLRRQLLRTFEWRLMFELFGLLNIRRS